MLSRLVTTALAASVAVVPLVAAVSPAVAAPAVSSSGPVATGHSSDVSAPVPTRPTVIVRPATGQKALTNPPMLRSGSSGPAVTAAQRRLAALGYWVGAPSGRYDHATAQGVMALQKVAALGRDGVTGPATWKALDGGVRPKARSTRGRVVEIDLTRQVLMLVVDGKIRHVINTSTGAKATPTPRGSFRVFRQIDRWHTAPLGRLYRPKYFYRGYAVHGVGDGYIPGSPASHGCARVGTKAMDMLWDVGGIRIGDRVLIY